MLLAALSALSLAVGPPQGADNTFHVAKDAGRAKVLNVTVAGGDVRVRAHRSNQVVLDAARSMGGAGCKAQLRPQGSDWAVEARDPAGRPCVIDVQLKVPAGLALKVRAGAGNVFVSGLRAALDLDVAQGNAVVGGTFPKLTVHLAEGSLSAQGLAGAATIGVEHGNVQLFVADELPGAGAAIALDVARGNVTLTSPHKGANLQLAVPAGQVQSQLESETAASKVVVTGEVRQGNFTARRGR